MPASQSSPTENPVLEPVGFWAFAHDHPDKVAVIEPDVQQLTFGDLFQRVNQLSHLLRDAGLGSGDHLAYLLPNSTIALELGLACTQIGVLYTPINPQLVVAEISYLVRDSGSKVFVADAQYGEAATQAADLVGIAPERRFGTGGLTGFRPLEEARASQATSLPSGRMMGSFFFYTSGSTGHPKGVVRPDRVQSFAEAMEARLDPSWTVGTDFASDGVHVAQGPLSFAGPLSYATNALQRGQTVVIMKKWVPEDCLRFIEEFGVTNSFMVPTMFYRLLKLPDEIRSKYSTASLRHNAVVHGAGSCPTYVKSAMLDWWGDVLYEQYGGNEGPFARITSEDARAHPGSVGRAFPNMTLAVFREDGSTCEPGEVGGIYAKIGWGEGLGSEYFGDPDKTARARMNGFATLGDMGYLDSEGWLFLVDRRTDLIVTGGINVYPAEVEAAIMRHPSVADVAVIGVPSEDWGSEVKAYVQPVSMAQAMPELAAEIIRFAHDHLASYKCPKSVEFRERLPRADTGKLYKGDLTGDDRRIV